MARHALFALTFLALASCSDADSSTDKKPPVRRDAAPDVRTTPDAGRVDSSASSDAGVADTSSSADGDAEDTGSSTDTSVEPTDAAEDGDSATVTDGSSSDVTSTDARSDANPSTDGGSLPTDFVVVRVGAGASPLSPVAAPVFLERRSISTGAVIDTTPLPTAPNGANLAFSLSGSSVAEGSLSRSTNGRRIALLGYQSLPGTANVQSVTDPRVVAVIDGAFAIDTRTTLSTVFSTSSPRGAVIDGNNIWVSGGVSGIFRTTLGATTGPENVAPTPTGGRDIAIFAGQLYSSTGSTPTGIYQIGTGLPLSPTSSMSVVPVPSPYGFRFFDLNTAEPGVDTLYVGDDSAGAGIRVFSRASGAWNTTPVATLGQPVRHIACFRDAADVVCVASAASTLYRVRHIGATTLSTQSDVMPIASAPTNTGFRGVALTPVP